MEDFRSYTEEIQKQLKLQSPPLAVKMLEKGEAIPQDAKRPKTDFGVCLSQCQPFAFAERYGMSIAMLKEDMWCPLPVIAYGLEAPPEYFLEGHTAYPTYFGTLEAGLNWVRDFPSFEAGKYVGIVSGPLETASFEPDLVMIYCNSIQLMRLLSAAHYKDGREITCKLSAMAYCVYAVVPAMQSRQCQLTIPCYGGRRYGGCQDDILVFTVPIEKLPDLVFGLTRTAAPIPVQIWTRAEYMLIDHYAELAGLMGMKKADGSEIVGKPAAQRLPWE